MGEVLNQLKLLTNEEVKSFIQRYLPKNELMKNTNFSTNGNIGIDERNKKYYWVPRKESRLYDVCIQGNFCLFYGPRSCGKTTTIVDISDQIYKESEFLPIYICMCLSISLSSHNEYWRDIIKAIYDSQGLSIPNEDILNLGITFFSNPNIFQGKKIILFLDEFDYIFSGSNEVINSINSQFGILQKGKNCIQSCVAIGTYKVRDIVKGSGNCPFDQVHLLPNNFTREEVFSLYNVFETKQKVLIDKKVKEEIFEKTDGHAGLVNYCGRILNDYKPYGETYISYEKWHKFYRIKSELEILNYQTTKRMVEFIEGCNELTQQTLIKYAQMFPNSYHYTENEEIKDLFANGLLKKEKLDNISTEMKAKIPSLYIYICILVKINHINRPKYPNIAIPLICGEYIHIPKLFYYLLPMFCFKNNMSFKNNRGSDPSNQLYNQQVPSENFYQFQFLSHLSSAFPFVHISLSVKEENTTKRVDSTLNYNNKMYVIEYAAHITDSDVFEHIKRTANYKKQIGSKVAWLIYFSVGGKKQKIQFKKYCSKYKDVGIIYIIHNMEFSNFDISYYSPNDNSTSIESFISLSKPDPDSSNIEPKLTKIPMV
ncbi:hypothetical protein CYY_006256 [Polysphondylium violaceum]|uniref:Uncharacterized protein n=1 Tax=Polysphondylium violaceum TaxID=133409 RepID=A0A8J4URL8_9MYCE|nr:hypothetical protein CYY_006256 [Polysphondylium violaceum]